MYHYLIGNYAFLRLVKKQQLENLVSIILSGLS